MSGLGEEFGAHVVPRNVDATTEENRPVCQDLGFQSHGLTITSADGAVLWTQADHGVDMKDVRGELVRLTAAN